MANQEGDSLKHESFFFLNEYIENNRIAERKNEWGQLLVIIISEKKCSLLAEKLLWYFSKAGRTTNKRNVSPSSVHSSWCDCNNNKTKLTKAPAIQIHLACW